jgi:hypothetical protein
MVGKDNRRRAGSWTFVLRYTPLPFTLSGSVPIFKNPRKAEIAAPLVLKPEGIIEPILAKDNFL